ncbi:MAG: DUF6279 family lipoprotein [Pseudomonadota bacterium]|nr:DUF6279 family lipoprotein [Pseudomonadota bacterium]
MNRKPFIILIVIVGLTACSSFRLLYDFVDDYILEEAQYFLKLDEQGVQNLNYQVNSMMNWHNATMLPNYATYLVSMADNLDRGLYGKKVVNKAIKDGRELVGRAVAGAAPYVARVLVDQTNTESIEYLRLKMLERNKKQYENLLKPLRNRTRERTERLKNNFERFMGKLTKKQDMLIDQYVKSTSDNWRKRLANLKLRQFALLNVLSKNPSEPELIKFIQQILMQSHEIVDPSYKALSENQIERFGGFLTQMFAFSSEEQRRLTAIKLKSYAEDFIDISR